MNRAHLVRHDPWWGCSARRTAARRGKSSALWYHPKRRRWKGGGDDLRHPLDCGGPRDHRGVTIGVSTGGVWRTRRWRGVAARDGMRAEHVPPELTHDPNARTSTASCNARRASEWWVQHHNGIFRSDDEGRTCRPRSPTSSRRGVRVSGGRGPRPDTAWFAPEIKDEKRIPVEGKLVRLAHARWWQELRGPVAGPAATTCLRRCLPSRSTSTLTGRN